MGEKNIKKLKTSRVASIIAHQLKTPISVIKGYLETLITGDRGTITPSQEEYLADALENLKKIADFVEELLDISRIEEGKLDIEPKPIFLEEIVNEVLTELSVWIKANNCEVSFKKPKKLSKVLADRKRIHQVIQNFITNAVLYKEGSGKIDISLEQKDQQILFTCKDSGVGVPEKEAKKVFSKFYRSEKSMEIDPSGAGLGLYINKSVIELMGGKIWFEKNKEGGMIFYFSLPIIKT